MDSASNLVTPAIETPIVSTGAEPSMDIRKPRKIYRNPKFLALLAMPIIIFILFYVFQPRFLMREMNNREYEFDRNKAVKYSLILSLLIFILYLAYLQFGDKIDKFFDK